MMDNYIKKWLNATLIIVLSHFFCIGTAQSAKNLFQNYWKVGALINSNIYFSENEVNSIDYELHNQKILAIGVTWNFYQNGNHNFKISLTKPLKYWESNYVKIKAEDIPNNYDYETITFIRSSNSQWKLNFLYEYFLPINDVAYISGALGPEILYYPEIRGKGAMGIGLDENGQYIVRVTEQTERVKDINLGLKTEASFYLASKIGLFQFRIEGLLGFNDYQETNVQAFNLAVSPDSNSKHSIKGHYLGFGVGYYLMKSKSK